MTSRWVSLLTAVVIVMAIAAAATVVHGGEVTYDGKSLIIDGQHKILFSGSIHYPRSTPEMWTSLISKAKEGGLDVIETYVFWNLHEPQQGQYDFSGRRDIVKFVKEIQAQGLYAFIRIGPFIESEWTYGGFPFWLHDVPGIEFRTDNEPFKDHMRNFTAKIVNMMKQDNLYASQGGPIILSQIENEYGMVEKSYHELGTAYVRWAAAMAVELQTGVPWVMCKQDDAPDPVTTFTPFSTFRYETYGDEKRLRTAQDIAFNVALFIANKNGSFVNYYMYHGGTNFGRTASAFVKARYYDQAPLDEYGLIRPRKWGHLKELHAAIKLCSNPLLSGAKTTYSLGPSQEAHVFEENPGACAAFLINNDEKNNATVQFRNDSYQLPYKSISILPDCRTVVTAQIAPRTMTLEKMFDSPEDWEVFTEAIPSFDNTTLRADSLLEQTNTTKDVSDYLWYTFRLEQNSSTTDSSLVMYSAGHVLHAFVNGIYAGSAHGSHADVRVQSASTVQLNKGTNYVSLLSATVGLPDNGAYLNRRVLGLRSVLIEEANFTNYQWGYQVGLMGEKLQIYTDEGAKSVAWTKLESSNQRLTWYKTVFDAPSGDDPVSLNLWSMGKGEVWVNGESIGRFWVSFKTTKGKPSESWYHIPRSLVKPSGNLLIILEEEMGNPLGISIDTVSRNPL
ncbi:hypothetical protein ACFE04_025949 [Oxalis oulophora]